MRRWVVGGHFAPPTAERGCGGAFRAGAGLPPAPPNRCPRKAAGKHPAAEPASSRSFPHTHTHKHTPPPHPHTPAAPQPAPRAGELHSAPRRPGARPPGPPHHHPCPGLRGGGGSCCCRSSLPFCSLAPEKANLLLRSDSAAAPCLRPARADVSRSSPRRSIGPAGRGAAAQQALAARHRGPGVSQQRPARAAPLGRRQH